MKQIILALLLVCGVSFATCTYNFTSTIEATGQYLVLAPGDCAYIADIDYTIYAPNATATPPTQYKYNETVSLDYGGVYNNTNASIVVYAPAKPSVNVALGFGEVYSNSSIGVVVSAPAKPNVNVNISSGSTYENVSVGFTAKCNPALLNENVSLAFGQSWENDLVKIKVVAPAFPKLNTVLSLNPGETWQPSDARYNFSVSAYQCNNTIQNATNCSQNIVTGIGYNGSYYNDACNITVTGPLYPNFNINRDLDYSETFVLNEVGIRLTSKPFPKIDEVKIMKPGDQITRSEYGEIIYCQGEESCDVCEVCDIIDCNETVYSLSENMTVDAVAAVLFSPKENETNCTSFMNLSIGNGGTRLVPTCSLVDYCTAEEITKGMAGLTECMQRNSNSNANVIDTCIKNKNDCEISLGLYKDGSLNANNLSETMLKYGIMGVGALAFIVFIATIVVYVIRRNQRGGV